MMMNLAERITDERKKRGWSQEELAYRLGVSRQAVSKWEMNQSTPDLERIIQMSELFEVTTDWLLKGETLATQEQEYEEPAHMTQLRILTREEAMDFLNIRSLKAKKIANAVMLCVLSPAALIVLTGMAGTGRSYLREQTAVLSGMIILFACVAGAVYMFMTSGLKEVPYRFMEKEPFELEKGCMERIMERKSRYMVEYQKGISMGVVLCILSVIPVVCASFLFQSDFAVTTAVGILLAVVSIGVRQIISVTMIKGSFDALLQEEDCSIEKKESRKRAEPISGIYWSVVTAGYLVYSFVFHQWGSSWLIFVLAGVLYEPVTALVGKMDRHE
ncbi:MAG: helix-turn-helix domain-containing protein [Bulleidia sp.]